MSEVLKTKVFRIKTFYKCKLPINELIHGLVVIVNTNVLPTSLMIGNL